MNTERLQILADFLKTIKKGKFHLDKWMDSYDFFLGNAELTPSVRREMEKFGDDDPGEIFIKTGKTVEYLGEKYNVVMPAQCKTAGCAFGWAPTIPAFKAAGLKMIDYVGDAEIYYDGHIGFAAAEDFFDITSGESNFLFNPGQYNEKDLGRPKAVAKRIEKLIKSHTKEQKAFYGVSLC